MKDRTFDALTRRIATGRHSRRELMKVATTAAMLSGVATSGVSAASPAAIPRGRGRRQQDQSVDPIIGEKAFELDYDPAKIIAFVTDEIRYEPYAGALRGARATLLGRAGNSVDQSLLLAELLEASMVKVRYANGELSSGERETLATLASGTVETFQTADLKAEQEALVLTLTASGIQTSPPSSGVDADLTAKFEQAKRSQVERARTQVADSVALLAAGLAEANVALPDLALAPPEPELSRHMWVQYANGSEWIDVDPVFGQNGTPPAVRQNIESSSHIPGELEHVVRIRVIGEFVSGDATQRIDLIDHAAPARSLAGAPILFTHVPPEDYAAIGLAIQGAIDGTFATVPTLMVGNNVIASDQNLFFANGQGGVFDDGAPGLADGEPIAVWLVIDSTSPGLPTSSVERPIFDRVGIVNRQDPTFAVRSLPNVEITDEATLGKTWKPLHAITSLSVTGARVPSSDLARFDVPELIPDQNELAAKTIKHLQGRFETEFGMESGYHFFPDRPNVTAMILNPATPEPGSKTVIESDVLLVGVRPAAVENVEPGVHPSVYAGALRHSAERATLDPTWVSEMSSTFTSSDFEVGVNAGRVFEVAATAGIALRTIRPADAADASVALPGSIEAQIRIQAALSAGRIVIVPSTEVEIGGSKTIGWWELDPASGLVIDRMENGRSTAMLSLVTFTEYAKTIYTGLRYAQGFKRMACIGAVLAIASGVLWSISAVQQGFSGTGSYGNFGGAILSGGAGIFGAPAACAI